MIDSIVWKDKLARSLPLLQKRQRQRRWSYRSIALLERELILSFFSIRILIEGGKLTDRCARKKYKCRTYLNAGKIVDELTKIEFWENYDFAAGKSSQLSLKFLTNQFIHAYLIFPDISKRRNATGVLLCSDWEKHNALIRVSLDSVISIIKDVINDEIQTIRTARDQKTGEFKKVKIS